MDLTLKRNKSGPDGIFGTLSDDSGQFVKVTLEHAYLEGTEDAPKIPDGNYTCVRGQHQLPGMAAPFTTFEITGVPGHSKLLFHTGNYNRDSKGCVLLGETEANIHGVTIITGSRIAFQAFMTLQEGIDEFQLTVLSS